MTPKSYWYRLFLSTWGIAIHIEYQDAESPLDYRVPSNQFGNVALYAYREDVKLPEDLRGLMLQGAKQIYQKFPAYFSGHLHLYINVVEFALTDFQEEALPYAFAEFIASVLEIPYIRPKVIFDKLLNRYLYLELP